MSWTIILLSWYILFCYLNSIGYVWMAEASLKTNSPEGRLTKLMRVFFFFLQTVCFSWCFLTSTKVFKIIAIIHHYSRAETWYFRSVSTVHNDTSLLDMLQCHYFPESPWPGKNWNLGPGSVLDRQESLNYEGPLSPTKYMVKNVLTDRSI